MRRKLATLLAVVVAALALAAPSLGDDGGWGSGGADGSASPGCSAAPDC